jgi:hypothetical protein
MLKPLARRCGWVQAGLEILVVLRASPACLFSISKMTSQVIFVYATFRK